MKKQFLLLLVFLATVVMASGQFSRYVVELKNKNGTAFTLANPSAYLSSKAIERRNRHKVTIDSTDLPVVPAYLDIIRSISGVTIINTSKWLNQVCIQSTDPTALSRINALPFVKTAAPVAARQLISGDIRAEKTEPILASSSRLSTANTITENVLNYGSTIDQVHMHNGEYLHNIKLAGEGMTIAVLDGGFFGYKTNPVFDSLRLQNRILGEWDFVANEAGVNEDNAHGMYCLSILAANRPGFMVGTAPKARYYLFRTEDVASEYPVEEQNWAAAAERADSLGVDMISSSLGYSYFDNPVFNHSYAERNGNVSIVTRAADLAAKKGIIVMNSAGNSGVDTGDPKFISCPADGDSVVAVGAVNRNGVIANFSSWGPNGAGKLKPNIVSLGQGTTIADFNGNPVTSNGTSFSNPNVAGLIACLWQAFPDLTNMDVIDAVQKSASRYNNPDDRYGYGIPDFKKAFSSLISSAFQGSASLDNCIATLTWKARDAAFIRYDLERRSGSDTGFTKIGSLPGKTDLLATNDYVFKDTLKFASATNISYRIKQVIGGDTSIEVMNVAFNVSDICLNDQKIIISPNPFTNNVSIVMNTPGAIPRLGITMHNVKGQLLYKYQGVKAEGLFTINIPASHLPAGVYVVTVTNGSRIISKNKVLK